MPLVLAPDTIVEVEPPPIPTLVLGAPSAPTVTVEPPGVPTAQPAAPVTPGVTVVPVVGPPGPRGPAGVSTNASYVWPVPVPVFLVQVVHELGFYPAGVTVMDQSGNPVEYAKLEYISTDIVEVSFDVLFSGTIYLS